MTTVSRNLQSATALGSPVTENTDTQLDSDAFMRLLVTQIKNQDPAKPMDTTEMMQQLTQMTEVERLVSMDGRLQSLQIANAAIANSQAVGLVGTIVEADTSRLMLDDMGSTHGTFELDGAAASTKVLIRNGEGDVVRTLELGAQAAGTRTFQWDGNDDNGQRVASGPYTITIEAKNDQGAPITSRTSVRGPVHSINYAQGYPALSIGETEVMMGDVRSVTHATQPISTTTTSE